MARRDGCATGEEHRSMPGQDEQGDTMAEEEIPVGTDWSSRVIGDAISRAGRPGKKHPKKSQASWTARQETSDAAMLCISAMQVSDAIIMHATIHAASALIAES